MPRLRLATPRPSRASTVALSSRSPWPVVGPLSLRAVNAVARHRAARTAATCRRSRTGATRKSFRTLADRALRYGNPEWVFIGDSMLGTRIHPQLLGELSGHGDRNVEFLFQAASGPAWWYLSFKNQLVAERREAARHVLLLPRHQPDRHDVPAAEPSRRRAGRSRARAASRSSTPSSRRGERGAVVARGRRAQSRCTRSTRPPRGCTRRSAAGTRSGSIPIRRARLHFENVIEEDFNQNFRRDLAADIGDARRRRGLRARSADVGAAADHGACRSAHQLPVCFVRVQRRPVGNRPPPQSPALQNVHRRLPRLGGRRRARASTTRPAIPELTLDLYEDGDHVADRRPLHADLPPPARSAVAMTFHSLPFVIFFPVVLAVYWRLPHRGQNVLLLGRELRVLRLDAPVVRRDHAGLDDGRLLGRPADGGRSGAQASGT